MIIPTPWIAAGGNVKYLQHGKSHQLAVLSKSLTPMAQDEAARIMAAAPDLLFFIEKLLNPDNGAIGKLPIALENEARVLTSRVQS